MQKGDQMERPLEITSDTWNLLSGRVVSILHGLTRTTIKVMTGRVVGCWRRPRLRAGLWRPRCAL